MMKDLENQRNKFINISAPPNQSDEAPVLKQSVKLREQKMPEANEDLAAKIRHEKNDLKNKQMTAEKEVKERLQRERQRMFEMEQLNRELEKGTYTYDYQGNIIFGANLNPDLLPPDFKFKYKFRKVSKNLTEEELAQTGGVKNGKKKVTIPFKDSKLTGYQAANFQQLSKLVDGKQSLLNVKPQAGSMFEFIVPSEAGVYIKEKSKVKFSKKDFEEIYGQMSLDNYNRKVGSDGNFQSSMIHPELRQPETKGEFPPNPNQNQVGSIKTDFHTKVLEFKVKQEYIQQLQQEAFEKRDPKQSQDGHRVQLQSPQSLNNLIEFPKQKTFSRTQLMNKSQSSMSMRSGNLQNKLQVSNMNILEAEFGGTENPKTKKQDQLQQITNDLFLYHKKTSSEYYTKSLSTQQLDVVNMFDDMNQQLANNQGWGFQASTKKKSGLKSTLNAGSQMGIGTSSVGSQGVGRPFSRATSQQSLRMTTAASTKSQRRNIQIFSQKFELDKKKHLAPPPLGKTIGHGLIETRNFETKDKLQNDGSASQSKLQLLGNSNHLPNYQPAKTANKLPRKML